jgi:5,10-methylene-tetrahydrofolate dehydrogenase/methenyl tetrahydrofolate cyclohydrolase
MHNHSPSAEQIMRLAGEALFLCQKVESNVVMLCRMLDTSEDVEPKLCNRLFGNSKEKTASLQTLKRALKEFGIDAEHYLLSELVTIQVL